MEPLIKFFPRKSQYSVPKDQMVPNWSWERIQDFVPADHVIVPQPPGSIERADELLKEFGAVIASDEKV